MTNMYTLLTVLPCVLHWSACAFLTVCTFPPNKLPSAAWIRCWYVPFLQTVLPANSVSCDGLLLFLLLPVFKMCLVSALVRDFLQLSSIVVPSEWSAWSAWSDCSVTCGLGEQVRVRVCDEDAEEFVDESNCQGNPQEMQSCYMSECPVSKADK